MKAAVQQRLSEHITFDGIENMKETYKQIGNMLKLRAGDQEEKTEEGKTQNATCEAKSGSSKLRRSGTNESSTSSNRSNKAAATRKDNATTLQEGELERLINHRQATPTNDSRDKKSARRSRLTSAK